jgi:hypothetical protein
MPAAAPVRGLTGEMLAHTIKRGEEVVAMTERTSKQVDRIAASCIAERLRTPQGKRLIEKAVPLGKKPSARPPNGWEEGIAPLDKAAKKVGGPKAQSGLAVFFLVR